MPDMSMSEEEKRLLFEVMNDLYGAQITLEDYEIYGDLHKDKVSDYADLIVRSDAISVHSRELLDIALSQQKEKTLADFTEIKPLVEFKAGDGFYYFRLPKLATKIYNTTKKIQNMPDSYLLECITMRIKESKKMYEMFDEFTAIFVHHYTKDEIQRDTDNIEIKKPIDAIGTVLIKNDTQKYSHICQFTVEDKESFTEMYILKGHSIFDKLLPNLDKLLNT